MKRLVMAIMVCYPNGAVRIRSVQDTAYPAAPAANFNEWHAYIKQANEVKASPMPIEPGEQLVQEAIQIINCN